MHIACICALKTIRCAKLAKAVSARLIKPRRILLFKLMPVQMLLGSSVHLLSVGGMAWQAWFDGEPTFLQIDAWPGRRQFFQDNAAALARETSQPRPWLCLVTIDTSSHFTGLRQARNLHQLLHIHELLRQVRGPAVLGKFPASIYKNCFPRMVPPSSSITCNVGSSAAEQSA